MAHSCWQRWQVRPVRAQKHLPCCHLAPLLQMIRRRAPLMGMTTQAQAALAAIEAPGCQHGQAGLSLNGAQAQQSHTVSAPGAGSCFLHCHMWAHRELAFEGAAPSWAPRHSASRRPCRRWQLRPAELRGWASCFSSQRPKRGRADSPASKLHLLLVQCEGAICSR